MLLVLPNSISSTFPERLLLLFNAKGGERPCDRVTKARAWTKTSPPRVQPTAHSYLAIPIIYHIAAIFKITYILSILQSADRKSTSQSE